MISHPDALQNTELSHKASAQEPSVMMHTATVLEQGLAHGQLLHAGQKVQTCSHHTQQFVHIVVSIHGLGFTTLGSIPRL